MSPKETDRRSVLKDNPYFQEFANAFEERFPGKELAAFTDRVDALLCRDSTLPSDWLDLYNESTGVARIVNEANPNELGIYLVSKARELNLDGEGSLESLHSAEHGLAIFIRIKAYSKAKEELSQKPSFCFPKRTDEMLPILTASITLEDELKIAKKIREVWHVSTPFQEGQEVESNEQLNQFLVVFSSVISRFSKRLSFSEALTAFSWKVSPKAMDCLIEEQPDKHFFNNAFAFSTFLPSSLTDLMIPSPIRELDLGIIPLIDKNTAQKILSWAKALRENRDAYDGFIHFLDEKDFYYLKRFILDIGDIIDHQDNYSFQDVQALLVQKARHSSHNVDEIMAGIKEVNPDLLEGGQEIPLLAEDINIRKIEEKRAELLLTDKDMHIFKERMEENRLRSQAPNTTEDILRIMKEIFNAREE